MPKWILLLMIGVLLSATNVLGHEAKGPHGGRIVDAGNYHLELVADGADIAVFISDSANKPLAPAGFKAIAILNAHGKAQRVVLTPEGGKLGGKAEVSLSADVKGMVQITAPDGKAAQGQFK